LSVLNCASVQEAILQLNGLELFDQTSKYPQFNKENKASSFIIQACSTKHHPVSRKSSVPFHPRDNEYCQLHQRHTHHIFLNYRVNHEGKRSLNSKKEPAGGVVEQMFKSLAVKKTKLGRPIFVFWDKQCLKDGQNWESGFTHGIQNSQVIILLMSNSTVQGIAGKAAQQEDNVLIEYECALLLNKIYEVPVFPVFLAELESNNKAMEFSFKCEIPDSTHCRGESSQRFIDKLRIHLPENERSFLSSIKKTMKEIFMLTGAFMPHRLEDESDLQSVIYRILATLETSIPVTFRPPLDTLPKYPLN